MNRGLIGNSVSSFTHALSCSTRTFSTPDGADVLCMTFSHMSADPFQSVALPDGVESTLAAEQWACCAAFNHSATLLAGAPLPPSPRHTKTYLHPLCAPALPCPAPLPSHPAAAFILS